MSIGKLIRKAEENTGDPELYALKDLGLLIERHTQDRYDDEEYSFLLDDDSVSNLRLSDSDIKFSIHYFMYRLVNKHPFPVMSAWCLGKCYGYPIEDGMLNLLKVYSDDDGVQVQLLYSLSAISDVRNYRAHFLELKTYLSDINKPLVNEYLNEILPSLFE